MATSCKIWHRVYSPFVSRYRHLIVSLRGLSNGDKNQENGVSSFDERLLEILVCPLTKKPLRYDATSNQLISDEIGVAYPVVNGIPNLIPSDGHIINPSTSKDQ